MPDILAHRDSSGAPVARHNEWCPPVAAAEETGLKTLVLGSTGSIGTQALEVIAANPDRFELVGWPPGAVTRTCWPASAPRPG